MSEPIRFRDIRLEGGCIIIRPEREDLGKAMSLIRKHKNKLYQLEVKEHRKKRSLDANQKLWALINEMSTILKLTPEEGAEKLEALGLDPTWATDANVAVMQKARRGDVESLRYLRDTIGEKPRDGLEIGNLDGQPLSTVDLSTLTDDQLRAMIAAREQSDQG